MTLISLLGKQRAITAPLSANTDDRPLEARVDVYLESRGPTPFWQPSQPGWLLLKAKPLRGKKAESVV